LNIKITNYLYHGFNNNPDDGILKYTNNPKTLLVLDYIYSNRNMKNITPFSLEDIIAHCGLAVRSGNGNTIDQFKNILHTLHNLKVIEIENLKLTPKQFNKCKLLIDIDRDFFYFNEDDKKKIFDYKHGNESSIDKFKAFLLYCYILSRIRQNTDGTTGVCYPSYSLITKDTGISDPVINKYINFLVKTDLIRVGNAGLFYYSADKNKRVTESSNIYAIFDKHGDWQDKLNDSIKTYKNNHPERIFVKSYKNNNKSENGYIARITYLEKQGKATEKQIEKRDKLLEKKREIDGGENIKFTIKSLLDNPNNSDILLSDIYINQGNINLAEKYSDIEKQLDIIDGETGEFLIDWDYYKWLMINYNSDQHEYYYNCVQKYIREHN